MNNSNVLIVMNIEEGIEVDWAYIMFNNLSIELNRWTNMQEKMQSDRKHEDKK